MEMVAITDIRFAKEGMRLGKKFSYLIFNSKEISEIVRNVLQYTKNFFVLFVSNIDDYRDKRPYFCNSETIGTVLEVIEKNGENITSEDPCIEYDCMIIMLDFFENERTKFDFLLHKIMKECQITYNILQVINKKFVFYNFMIEDGYIILQYIEKNRIRQIHHVSAISEKDCLFMNYKGGIGDYIMNLSLIYDFIQDCGYSQDKIYLIMFDGISQIDLVKCFFPAIHIVKIAGYTLLRLLMEKTKENSNSESEIYDFDGNQFIDLTELYGSGHIWDLNGRIMFPNREINPFHHIEMMKKKVMHLISEERKKQIDDMFDKNKQYIAFQFFTGELIHDKKYIGRETRCWNEENTYTFYKKCVENNINVVIMSPHCYREMKSSIEIGKLSIFEYIYTVSKFDLIVGIDSSAGHIASFWNIPTLTIWGEQTPLVCEGNNIGFRVLRNNYGIVPKNRDINSVKPEVVFKTMKKILLNEIELDSNHLITYEDSVNGYNTMFV